MLQLVSMHIIQTEDHSCIFVWSIYSKNKNFYNFYNKNEMYKYAICDVT